jgi:hypothetical protein
MVPFVSASADPLAPPEAAALTARLLDGKVWLVHAVIVRVIDGDTVVVNMDLGWHTWRHDEHVRLNGIDAPERTDPVRWAEAKACVERLLPADLFRGAPEEEPMARLNRPDLRRLSDRALEQRLRAARAPTLAQLARETRAPRREWVRRQALRPSLPPEEAYAEAREVGRLIETAEQRLHDEQHAAQACASAASVRLPPRTRNYLGRCSWGIAPVSREALKPRYQARLME